MSDDRKLTRSEIWEHRKGTLEMAREEWTKLWVALGKFRCAQFAQMKGNHYRPRLAEQWGPLSRLVPAEDAFFRAFDLPLSPSAESRPNRPGGPWRHFERVAWSRFFRARNLLWASYYEDTVATRFIAARCWRTKIAVALRGNGKTFDEFMADVAVIYWAVATRAAAARDAKAGDTARWLTRSSIGIWQSWALGELMDKGGVTSRRPTESATFIALDSPRALAYDADLDLEDVEFCFDEEEDLDGTWAACLATGGEDAMIAMLDAKRAHQRAHQIEEN